MSMSIIGTILMFFPLFLTPRGFFAVMTILYVSRFGTSFSQLMALKWKYQPKENQSISMKSDSNGIWQPQSKSNNHVKRYSMQNSNNSGQETPVMARKEINNKNNHDDKGYNNTGQSLINNSKTNSTMGQKTNENSISKDLEIEFSGSKNFHSEGKK
eukprot:c20036_g1_i2.p1 GENE.c20036_g1_i2~~c20036_g1_i2.p1  ORF type:complete len:157 (-),score=50.72 c20036_g1_i2:38-508(-)